MRNEVEGDMQISIIIPVYNTDIPDFIKCIESIQNQTFSDYEILVIDDGSREMIAKELDVIAQKDERIKVAHIKNAGVSVARNYGMNLAKGKYILFVDADDILTPWALQSGMDAITATDSDVAIGRILQTKRDNVYWNSQEKTQEVIYEVLDSQEKREQFQRHIFSKKYGTWGRNEKGWMFNGEGCWAHLIRREVAIRFPFIEGLAIAEDTVWNIQMLENTENIKFCLVDDLWYYYIQNENSVMNSYSPYINDNISRAVSILNPIFVCKNSEAYTAYLEWTIIKLKQIVYRNYLAAECKMTAIQKLLSMRRLITHTPWKEIFKYKQGIKGRNTLIIMLYRFNLMIPYFAIKKKFKEKR